MPAALKDVGRKLYVGIRSRYNRAYAKYGSVDVDSYGVDIDPFSRTDVDPDAIRRRTGRIRSADVGRVMSDIGSVRAGDWDRREGYNTVPHMPSAFADLVIAETIEESGIYQSFVERFCEGVPWEETEYYNSVLNTIRSGAHWHHCRDEADLRDRVAELDRIYERMKREGYETQDELASHPDPLIELANEVCIDRSRTGEPLLVCGQHRLCMAKILGLDSIPVTVVVRHEDWITRLESSDTPPSLTRDPAPPTC